MKRLVSTLAVVVVLALTTGARAGENGRKGYTNADIDGGYGCGVNGTLGGATTVGTAQFHPQGDGTFSESVLLVQLNGVGVCSYSLVAGTGTYDINPNGTGLAQFQYALQTGSATGCPSTFSSHLTFVCSGLPITASTCDIATLDTGILLSGTCHKQNK
jgi:hypothetical protein